MKSLMLEFMYGKGGVPITNVASSDKIFRSCAASRNKSDIWDCRKGLNRLVND